MQLAIHKQDRNKGSKKEFSAKVSGDVGIVPPVKQLHGKKQLVEKVQKQGGVCNNIQTTKVNICQLQGMLDTNFTIPTSGNNFR